MLTIRPLLLAFILGNTALVTRTKPKKFVSKTPFISSILWVSSSPNNPTPALLTEKICTILQLQHYLLYVSTRVLTFVFQTFCKFAVNMGGGLDFTEAEPVRFALFVLITNQVRICETDHLSSPSYSFLFPSLSFTLEFNMAPGRSNGCF